MNHSKHSSIFFTLLLTTVFALVSAACTGATEEVAVAVQPTPGIEVPGGVVAARDAVLDFLRRDANECIPPEGVRWQADVGKTPVGFGVYNFHADSCVVTVSYPLAGEAPRYHVGLSSGSTGFCWQARVNDEGQVIDTGTDAELEPELAAVAAGYCQNKGYEHTIETQPDGSRCGICTFDDGSSCKAWLFYQGECGPETANN